MGTDVEDTALSQNAGKGQPEDRAGVSEKKGGTAGSNSLGTRTHPVSNT